MQLTVHAPKTIYEEKPCGTFAKSGPCSKSRKGYCLYYSNDTSAPVYVFSQDSPRANMDEIMYRVYRLLGQYKGCDGSSNKRIKEKNIIFMFKKRL